MILKLIKRAIRKYKEIRCWKKHGNHTRYHLIGDNFHVGDFTHGVPILYRYDSTTQLTIGRFSSLAAGIKIMLGGNHHIDWVSTYAFYQEQASFPHNNEWTQDERGDIVIGNDVWIGRDVMILSGVTIGDGSVIGAGAVVAKNIPPYAIAAGNPARIIRKRFSENQIKALEQIQWWNWDIEEVNAHLHLIRSANINEFIQSVLGEEWEQKL